MSIESDNAKEEINEIVEKCIKCGFCKERDALFKVTREEKDSPRGKAILLQNNSYSEIFYDDTLSGMCEISCPLKIKMHEAIQKARIVLTEENKQPHSAKEILKNLEKTGNIFGEKK